MRNVMKRALSLALALMMVVSIMVFAGVESVAVSDSDFSVKIASLRNKFIHGQYWNSYNSIGYEGTGTSICPSCRGKGYCAGNCPDACGQFYYNGSWVSGQCLGFACKLGNAIFGGNPLAWNKHYDAYSLRPGDILYGNLTSVMGSSMHGIFITSISGETVIYADCNASGPCMVTWDKKTTLSAINKATSNGGAVIYHASNNNVSSGATPTPPYIYTDIPQTTYHLKNKATGTYLDVHNLNDHDFANVGMCTFNGSNAQRFTVSSGAYGYILKPVYTNRILNAYGDAPGSGANVDIYQNVNESSQQWKFEAAPGGGYYIHNMYNPSCVLDTDGSNAVITAKHGGDSQIWYLEEVDHQHDYTEFVFFWKSHPHYNCYKCSCGEIKEDISTSNYIDYCTVCNTPSKPNLVGLSSKYTSPASVTFTWTDTTHTTHNNLWVYKKQDNGDWKVYNRMDLASNNTALTFDPGEYKAVVYAYNSNMWNEDHSDWLYTASDDYFFTVESGFKFADVKGGDWYYDSVKYAVDNGLFNGVAADKFAPNMAMNRAMLVTVLYRMEGEPAISGAMSFTDVKSGQYYYKAVLWASQRGIVNGVTANSFAPEDNITREQMAAILYRYSTTKGYDVSAVANLAKYPDASKISLYAMDAFSWANAEGLIGGTDIGGAAHLDPKGKATRAQVATILMRFKQNVA